MGTAISIETAITNIKNDVSETINQSANADASAICRIQVESFEFTNTTNCTGRVINNCKAQAEITMKTITDSSMKVFNNLTNEQKQGVPGLFQQTFGVTTTVNNIQDSFEKVVNERCNANAVVENTQKYNIIKIDGCNSTQGLITFEFLNTGEASSVCAMDLITKLGVTAVNDVKNTQSTGIDFNALIWPIVIVLGIISIIYIIISFVNKKVLNVEDQISLLKYKTNTYASRIAVLKSSFL